MLRFNVNGQTIQRMDKGFVTFATGLEAEFSFLSKEWEDKTITAFFYDEEQNCYPVLLNEENICVVPVEVLKHKEYFTVGVSNGSIITTTKVRIPLNNSCYSEKTTNQITEDLYTQIMRRLDNSGNYTPIQNNSPLEQVKIADDGGIIFVFKEDEE